VLQPLSGKICDKAAIVAVEMGYGHLRPAQTLSDYLEVPIWRADLSPFATASEELIWARIRHINELLCQATHLPGWLGKSTRGLMDSVMRIEPIHGSRDLSRPTVGAVALASLIERGFGRSMVDRIRSTGLPLLTTYYATSIMGQMAGLDRVYCVVTDADINRVWVPRNVSFANVYYFVPSQRVVDRLRAYGVPESQIGLTGFPLPADLLGDRQASIARPHLGRRLVRLDPNERFIRGHHSEISKVLGGLPSNERGQPPLLTFAVGGAGAQQHLSDRFLSSLQTLIRKGLLRVALVAGTRHDVRLRFEKQIDRHGLRNALGVQLQILVEPDFLTYYRRFNQLLAETDILWTKPSELVFYAALGIPFILSEPLGPHEMYNRTWLIEGGGAMDQRCPSSAEDWLTEWLNEGVLAKLAWASFVNLPKLGTCQIAEKIAADSRERCRKP
jgi:hypothetical protein